MIVRNLIIAASLLLGACGNSVVGGECADGYESCDGVCAPKGQCEEQKIAKMCPKGGSAEPAADTGPTSSDAGATSETSSCGDVTSDPFNCGACGHICMSGACSAGSCSVVGLGDAVVIGHDFVDAAPGQAIANLAANAVFVGHQNPVRVIAWDQYADKAAVKAVISILDRASYASGRRYEWSLATSASDLAVQATPAAFDVVLVFDQVNAAPGELAAAGATLKPALEAFGAGGRMVIALDGGRGTGEMPELITAAGIASITHRDAGGFMLDLAAPTDVIGHGLAAPYKAPIGSVTFSSTGPSSLQSIIVDPVTAQPVVLHRVMGKK
jgi:hypothetical protein